MALIGTLTEDFGAALDSGKWPSQGGMSVAGGVGTQACSTSYNTLESAQTYTLDESAVYAKVTPTPNSAGTSVYTQMAVRSSTAGTDIMITHDAPTGNVKFAMRVGYFDAGETTLTYNATNHAYWRIRETGGTTYWDTSPDGSTWTNQRSQTSPSWVTDATLSLALQTNAATITSGGNAVYDNINTTGGGGGGATNVTDIAATFASAPGTGWTVPTHLTTANGVGTFAIPAATQETLTTAFTYGWVSTDELVCVEIVTPPSAATEAHVELAVVPGNAGGGYVCYIKQGLIHFEARPTGQWWDSSGDAYTTPYDATSMRWIGIQRTSGGVKFVTSADGYNWTTRRDTGTTLGYLNYTDGLGVQVAVSGGTSGTTVVIDNVNNPTASTPEPPSGAVEFLESFESYPSGAWAEGNPSPQSAKWNVVYNGGGTLTSVDDAGDQMLRFGTGHSRVFALGNFNPTVDVDMWWKIFRYTSTDIADWQDVKIRWGWQSETSSYEFLTRRLGDAGTTLGWTVLKDGVVLGMGNENAGAGEWCDLRIQHSATGTITVTVDSVVTVVTNGAPFVAGPIGIESFGGTGFYAYVREVIATTTVGGPGITPPPTGVTVPAAPTIESVTPVEDGLALTWSAPANDGGLPITSYWVEFDPDGSSPVISYQVPPHYRFFSVQSLNSSLTYRIYLTAINALGPGAYATSYPHDPGELIVIPEVPTAPTITSTVAERKAIYVAWTAPSSDGGNDIDSYRVEVFNASGKVTEMLTGPTSLAAVISGLDAGVPVWAFVTAHNVAGWGAVSPQGAVTMPLLGVALHGHSAFGAILPAATGTPTLAEITDYQQNVGERLNPVTITLPAGLQVAPTNLKGMASELGQTLFVRFDFSGIPTTKVANGSYDEQMQRLASMLALFDRDIYVTAYWESADWTQPWSPSYSDSVPGYSVAASCGTTDIAQIRDAFGRFARAMRNAPKVHVVWIGTVDPQPSGTDNRSVLHYPAGYVDVIALAGRNYGEGNLRYPSTAAGWRSHSTIFDGAYDTFRNLSPAKTIWLITACHDPATTYSPTTVGYPPGTVIPADSAHSKATWIADLFAETDYSVVTAVLWDEANTERNFAADSTSMALTGLRQAINPGCPPDPLTSEGYQQVTLPRSIMTLTPETRIRQFGEWLQAGATSAVQAFHPYTRPDAYPQAVNGHLTGLALPSTRGTKDSGYTVTQVDLDAWDRVHAYLFREAARWGMETAWRVSGAVPANYSPLMYPATVGADGLELVGTNDTETGVIQQSVAGNLDSTFVPNQSPTVTMTLSATTGVSPLTIVATAVGTDPDGSITSYVFNWGDGTPSYAATNGQAQHTYTTSASRTYLVTVRITDNSGNTAQTSAQVYVNVPVNSLVPSACQSIVGTAGDAVASISWAPPVNDGGSPVTGYRVARDGVDQNSGGPYTTDLGPEARSFDFTLLVNTNTYALTIAALNANGVGLVTTKSVTPTVTGGGGGTPPPVGGIDYQYALNCTSVIQTVAPEYVGYGSTTYGDRPDNNAELREAERRCDARIIRVPVGYRNGRVTSSANNGPTDFNMVDLTNIYKGWGRRIVAVVGGASSDWYSTTDHNAKNATKMFTAMGRDNIDWSSSNEPDLQSQNNASVLNQFNQIWTEGSTYFGSTFRLWGPVTFSPFDSGQQLDTYFADNVDPNRVAGQNGHCYATGSDAFVSTAGIFDRGGVTRYRTEAQALITRLGNRGFTGAYNWDELNYAWIRRWDSGNGGDIQAFYQADNTVFIAASIAESLKAGAIAMPYGAQNGLLGVWQDWESSGITGRPARTPMPALWGICAFTGGFINDGTTRRFSHFKDKVLNLTATAGSPGNRYVTIALNNEEGGYNVVLCNADTVTKASRIALSNVASGSYKVFQTRASNPYDPPVESGPFAYTAGGNIDVSTPSMTVTTIVLKPGG